MTDSQDDSADASAPLRRDKRLASLLVRLDAARRIEEQASGLTAADLRLLWFFQDGTAHTQREIAEALSLEQSTVNRQVNAALRAGLLSRSRPEGQTAYLIAPTSRGAKEFERAVVRTLESFESSLAALGERAEELLELLEKLVGSYSAAAGQHSARPTD